MPPIKAQDFIEELRLDIKTRNKVKAHLVLKHYGMVDENTRRMALMELSRADARFVFQVLVGLLAALPELQESHPELKELVYAKALDHPGIVTDLLIREARTGHRILLAEITGEIRLTEAVPTLLGLLTESHDERVLGGIINAMGMIADPAATTAISEFLYSGSADLIITAIRALGQVGTRTALQRLSDKLGADQDLDYMILDVMAASQEPEALELINATLSAHHAQVRNAGKQRLIRIGPKAVSILIKNLRYQDPDLLIHTLNVLGEIGDESAMGPIRKMLFNEPKDPNVRFAAYEALGRLPVAKGAFALAQGLHDSVDNVRTAAATAIDHNYNTVLAAGIKNMIRDEDGDKRPVSRTIIDAHCDTIFMDLINEPQFADFAVEYIVAHAHEDTRIHYVDLLNTHSKADLAARIDLKPEAPKKTIPSVFAVDDSKMILNIYRSVLHNLGCEPVLFEYPAEAVKQVEEHTPDLIFTDLNMPAISGIEFTQAVRKIFSKEQLPIIMVTTQNEASDNEAALAAGVNAILYKPFNEESLRSTLESSLRAN
jgi:CheY-like chemotaxis protein